MNKGDIIGGRYRLDRKIGQGGTGRIWLAQDGRLDRRVAIKFLFAQNPAHRARLAKRVALEAKIAASIQHRNVIQMFDFGTHEGDVPYIVMEALTGFTLGEAFDAAQQFSLDEVTYILSEVLRGLSAVHEAGIVHRDLKPENIFLVREARGKLSPKLLDFGISRSLEPDTRPSAVTTTEGMIVGTPEYMSPEQARGDSNIDKRTDIYSLGTILFETFAGMVPFPARSIAERLIAVIQLESPPLFELVPELGQPFCTVVDKALAKDRNKRYAHADEMLDAVIAAGLDVPKELDRHAPMFPPPSIRDRIKQRDADEDGSSGVVDSKAPVLPTTAHITPETVEDPSVSFRRGRRSQTKASEQPLLPQIPSGMPFGAAAVGAASRSITFARGPGVPRNLAIAVAALGMLGLVGVVAFMLIERAREPEGSGLIVVQAPNSAPAQQPPAQPTPAEAAAAEQEAEPAASAARGELGVNTKKPAAAKGRKPAAAQDPLQLMAASVADAFSKQKAGVIACLNEHSSDVEGEPQLKVRLQIDRNGVATDSELLPASISGKPVAGCLKAAVAKMRFQKLDQPTTFNVPLLWRRK